MHIHNKDTLKKTMEFLCKDQIKSIIYNSGILIFDDFHHYYHLVNNLIFMDALLPQKKFISFKDLNPIFNVICHTF